MDHKDFVVICHRHPSGPSRAETLEATGYLGASLFEPHDDNELRQELPEIIDRNLIVMGGDGSVNHLINAAGSTGLLSHLQFGLLPCGTGNDLARNTKLDRNLKRALRQLRDLAPRKIDLIKCEDGRYVINSAHAGLGAASVARSESWKKRLGPLTYTAGGLAVGCRKASWDLSVEVDEKPLLPVKNGGGVLMLAVGNSTFDGGGLPTTPGAEIDDGKLHVMISTAQTLPNKLTFGVQLMFAKHGTRNDTAVGSGLKVKVKGQRTDWYDDGELSGNFETREFEVIPSATKMLRP